MDIPKIILDLLKDHLPGLMMVYLFGSQSEGSIREDSDIDLAVLCQEALDDAFRIHFAADLASVINQDVDLLDLQSASTVMRVQVIKNGKCIYCRNDNIKAEFEMLTLADYARLNEERWDILRNFYGDR